MYTFLILSSVVLCKIYRVSNHRGHHRMIVIPCFSDIVLMAKFFSIFSVHFFSYRD